MIEQADLYSWLGHTDSHIIHNNPLGDPFPLGNGSKDKKHFEGSEAPHASEIESKSNIFIRTKNFSPYLNRTER